MIPLAVQAQPQQQTQKNLQHAVERMIAQGTPAVAISVRRFGRPYLSAAAGSATADMPMTIGTPVRIASVTKPYVAATLIKLADQQGISLATPVIEFLPAAYRVSLEEGGFDSSAITLQQLLSHTAGLPDHSQHWYYQLVAFLSRWSEWTPLEQVQMMNRVGGPLWPPGQGYRYSDTGYVLLGAVIEQMSGQSLHAAVRQQVLDPAALGDTWWERYEPAPESLPVRARQYIYGFDMSGVSPTVDLYGGGGLVSTSADMANFFERLFFPADAGGQIFDGPRQLAAMLQTSGLANDPDYRHGIAVREVANLAVYEHGGYWGVSAMWVPQLSLALAGISTEQNDYLTMRALMLELIVKLAEDESS